MHTETKRQKLARLARENGDHQYARDVESRKVSMRYLAARLNYYSAHISG